jgi:hypothetical protein
VGDRVRNYADVVVAALGGPGGDPRRADLLAAADALDAALAAPATLDVAIDRWRSATDALQHELAAYLLAEVPVDALPGGLPPWRSPAGVAVSASIGPLAAHVDAPALLVADPRRANAPPIVIGPLPPSSVRARLDAGAVSGDGRLTILDDGVNGALALHLGAVEVTALASLRRTEGRASFVAVMAAGFTPGIQLGFGFQLSRVGGVVGINRSIDADALAARLRDGSAGEALFPLDAGDGARRALAAIEAIVPPRIGSSVAGPTLRLSWLEIAGQGFCSLDVGVLLELPGPQRTVIVGVARAGIPPVLILRIDVIGVIDLPRRLLSIDASLIDSGLLGIFRITGDAAFRQSWGSPPYTVATLGGFYPGFRPEPAQIAPMRRLGFHLDAPVPGIRLRADGYLAVTSNTVQLGGYFEAGINAAGCGAHGFLGVDAIVQFSPFRLHAAVSAGFEVEVFGLTFCGVRLDGTVDGPGPVTLHGRLTVETFLEDFSFDETFTFGRHDAPPPPVAARAAEVLRDEEVRPDTLHAVGGTDRDVVLSPLPVPPGRALVQPRGGVAWQQRRVPLTIPIDRLDGAPLGSMQRVTATVPNQSGGVDELFAPGSFITLSDAEALNRPAFERLPAGIVSAGGADVTGGTKQQRTTPIEFRKVRAEPWERVAASTRFLLDLPAGVLSMLAARDAPSIVATTAPLVTVGVEPWVSVADGEEHPSATAAHQRARQVGGLAISRADVDAPVTIGGL